MKSINLIVASLFLSLTLYSQTLILNKKGDTTICFSIEQSKYLASEHYRAEENSQLYSLCELKYKEKDAQINMYKKIYEDLENVLNNEISIKKLKDIEIESLKSTIESKNKSIKIQKVYKWVSILSGGFISSYIGYKYITK